MTSNNNKNKSENNNIPYWKNQKPPIKGQEFTDPLFPPNNKSLLGLNSNNKPIDPESYNENKHLSRCKIEFKRPREIFNDKKYHLFSEVIEINDIVQGFLNDCYFLASVTNLCKFPELILNLFNTKNINEDGYYEIIFYIDGIKQIVIVDDYIPILEFTNQPIFAQPHDNKIWAMILEKAWAKINGGYVNINYGWVSDAFEFLTGFGSLEYDLLDKNKEDLVESKIEIIKNIQIADKNNSFITCSSYDDDNIEEFGLVSNHAYTLVDINQIETSSGKIVYLFRIKNPHSKGEWTGDWSDTSTLWDEKTKNQVKYNDKEDGIFFMNDTDFFKYFECIDICNILYDAKSITYSIENEENLRNGIVFNILIEKEGILNVLAFREHWRVHRETKKKILPTHISIVKFDPNQKNKLKIFSDYNGIYESYKTCSITTHVKKGHYLIYVYRDYEHAEFTPDKKLKVKIICTSEFRHAQMSFDKRDKGFPLLQNIILQAEFIENHYDPDSFEDFKLISTQIRGNGIGHAIFYISNPGYFLNIEASTEKIKNYIMLSPYLSNQQKFTNSISSGKYLVILGLKTGRPGIYYFNPIKNSYYTSKKIKENYLNNDIDLNIYLDIKNDIKNKNLKESKIQTIVKTKTEFYFDAGNGEVIYSSFSDLVSQYGDIINLLDDVFFKYDDSDLKWGILKGEYATYI